MQAAIFNGIFNTGTSVISVTDFLMCIAVSLGIGVFLGMVYMFKSRYTQSFVVTLAMLPGVVCVVIMLVNGNIGAGVAVAGAFSLVRFRSVPGTAREIGAIFLAMGTGLIAGMGYLAYSVLFALLLGGISMLYTLTGFGEKRNTILQKTLNITIPEDLDYPEVFDDLLDKFTSSYELMQVKTTNMGSMFRLVYQVELREAAGEKKFIDELRCRNGNLEISISRQENIYCEL